MTEEKQKESESERTARRTVRATLDTLVTTVASVIMAGAFMGEVSHIYEVNPVPDGTYIKYFLGAGATWGIYAIARSLFLSDPK